MDHPRLLIRVATILVLANPAGAGASERIHGEAHSPETPSLVAGDSLAGGPIGTAGALAVIRDIRRLYVLQEAAAMGRRDLALQQKPMLARIGVSLSGAISKSDPNLLAPHVVGFTLSGGNPSHAEALVNRPGTSLSYKKLLMGAANYVRRNPKGAEEQLRGIDARKLPPSIAGRVALTQAMLSSGDAVLQQRLLAEAIALMPGSLVEESSLRRSAGLFAEAKRQGLFWARCGQYVRRFPRSLYAGEFFREVVDHVVAFEQSGLSPDLRKLDLLLGTLRSADRRALYLQLSRQAASRNLAALTEFAARRLVRLSEAGGQDAQLGKLYGVIFNVASEHVAEANAVLREVRSSDIPAREQRLRAAALAVAKQVLDPFEPQTTTMVDTPDGDVVAQLQKSVDMMLGDADRTIKEARE